MKILLILAIICVIGLIVKDIILKDYIHALLEFALLLCYIQFIPRANKEKTKK